MGNIFKKNDIILIGLCLVIAVLAYGGIYLYQDKSTGDGIVVVTVDGEEYATYSLKENTTHTIEFSDGSYLVFQNGVMTGGKTASGATF